MEAKEEGEDEGTCKMLCVIILSAHDEGPRRWWRDLDRAEIRNHPSPPSDPASLGFGGSIVGSEFRVLAGNLCRGSLDRVRCPERNFIFLRHPLARFGEI